jgi:hypothetical protein
MVLQSIVSTKFVNRIPSQCIKNEKVVPVAKIKTVSRSLFYLKITYLLVGFSRISNQ